MNAVARIVKYILVALLAVAVAAGLLVAAALQGLLSPFGIEQESADNQVVTAVERTQEVSLLSLAVQGIKTEERNRTAFGVAIPGSSETVLLQYDFDAKLGMDGAQVEIEETSENAFLISIPEFSFIGFDEPTFKVAANNGGVLSFVTPDVEPVDMVNEILNGSAREQYLRDNDAALRDQAAAFFASIIQGIEPDAELTFEYAS